MAAFNDLQQMLKDFQKQLEKLENNASSNEQYKKTKERFDEIATKVKDFAKSNPLFGGIIETLLSTVDKEMEQLKQKSAPQKPSNTIVGFDLVNDPKAVEKIEEYLTSLQSNYDSMSKAQFSQAIEPLIDLVESFEVDVFPTNIVEKDFMDSVVRRVEALTVLAGISQKGIQSKSTFKYKETQFDIFDPAFAVQYRAYLEDVALNSAEKDRPQLLDIGRVLRIIADDLKQTRPENADEERFLQEVAFQTPVLLKIVDRQIVLKSAPQAAAQTEPRVIQPRVSNRKQDATKTADRSIAPKKATTKKTPTKAVKKDVKASPSTAAKKSTKTTKKAVVSSTQKQPRKKTSKP